MTYSNRKQPARAGFTLIELLVVIAIIAILAAILFPVFIGAKKAAQRSQCISNMKQIGLAIKIYDQEYDGRIFGFWYPYSTATPDSAPYINTYRKYTRNDRVFQCPADAYFGYGKLHNYPTTCSYAYSGGTSTNPRNLDAESGKRECRSQANWVVTDCRYMPYAGPSGKYDWNAAGYTLSAHGGVYWAGNSSADAAYIPGLGCVRLYPDCHARYCKGWQRFAYANNDPRNGAYLGDMP